MFDEVEIDLADGKTLTIEAERTSPDDIYISSMELGGKPLKKYRVSHDELLNGGRVDMKLSSRPRK